MGTEEKPCSSAASELVEKVTKWILEELPNIIDNNKMAVPVPGSPYQLYVCFSTTAERTPQRLLTLTCSRSEKAPKKQIQTFVYKLRQHLQKRLEEERKTKDIRVLTDLRHVA